MSFKKSAHTSSVLEANREAGTRLELLLFKLNGYQTFGINVFKVQEIISAPALTKLPQSHHHVLGIANLRNQTISVIDLAAAIGQRSLNDTADGKIIITEYNRSTHGFLVKGVCRIEHVGWDKVESLPSGSGKNSYVTSVVTINDTLIGILDVEKILDEIVQTNTTVCNTITENAGVSQKRVLVVDDSLVARKQIEISLRQIAVECDTVENAQSALALLEDLKQQGISPGQQYSMIISDIEMPGMDGYQLTAEIRKRFDDTYILLHSSISGEFNIDRVNETGANRFMQKYDPNDLASVVLEELNRQTV